MNTLKKPAARRKLSLRASEAAFMAVCHLLVTGKSTREENRVAVRHLLRQAAKSPRESHG